MNATCGKNACNHIRNDDTHKNWNNFPHSFSPYIENNDCHKSNQRKRPVHRSVADCRSGKIESDTDNDRSCHYRWKKTHYFFHSDQLNDQCQNQIQKSRDHDTSAGISKFIISTHAGIFPIVKICHGSKSAQKGKGRSQKSRNF